MYPGIGFGSVLGADAAGTEALFLQFIPLPWRFMQLCLGVVIASADRNDPLLDKRVFLLPMRGWEKHPDAPESR